MKRFFSNNNFMNHQLSRGCKFGANICGIFVVVPVKFENCRRQPFCREKHGRILLTKTDDS